jgi:hypothetical protein
LDNNSTKAPSIPRITEIFGYSASPKYLRYYLVEAANLIRMHDREYAAFYTAKYNEAHTHKHKRALVLTARKLVRLVYALLRTNQLYIPRKYKYAPLLLARSLAQ